MTETYDRRSSHRVRAQLEQARSAGGWMPWFATFLAIAMWAAIGAYVFLNIGLEAVLAQGPLVIASQAGLAIVPGLALICAGVMARESRRSTEANALVLTSARLLLEPADRAREEITSIAEAVARETQFVNKALGETRGRLDGLRADIEQSVTAALKAAEIVRADSEVLVGKMASERKSLADLSETLKAQAGDLSKAIPLHAQMLTEAARAAQKEVANANETLGQRLSGVDEAARRLAERIDQLDTMGAESRKRAQNLAGALARMDEQLVQSTRMVDAAVKAGELATAASKSTADALRDAMSDALDAALKSSETIHERSTAASETARASIALLKEAGQQAEATTKSAAMAARAHAEEVEQRVARVNDLINGASNRAVVAAETGLERAKSRIERATLLLHNMQEETHTDSSVDDLAMPPLQQPRAAPYPASEPGPPIPPPFEILREPLRITPVTSNSGALNIAAQNNGAAQPKPVEFRPVESRPVETKPVAPKPTASADFSSARREATPAPAPDPAPHRFALGGGANGHGSAHNNGAAAKTSAANGHTSNGHNGSASDSSTHSLTSNGAHNGQAFPLQAREVEIQPDVFVRRPTPLPPHVVGEDTPGLSWRDLLTGIEEADQQQPLREDAVATVIDRLDRAGVRLNRAVRASDLRRIALAAHQGERQRRRATRDVNPSEIQRVARLLDADRELQIAARRFVATEEPSALRQLASAERAREDAAPRLSAYLLLDAALGAVM